MFTPNGVVVAMPSPNETLFASHTPDGVPDPKGAIEPGDVEIWTNIWNSKTQKHAGWKRLRYANPLEMALFSALGKERETSEASRKMLEEAAR
jgi:hypothetical protein